MSIVLFKAWVSVVAVLFCASCPVWPVSDRLRELIWSALAVCLVLGTLGAVVFMWMAP